jgi:hypothetical protein
MIEVQARLFGEEGHPGGSPLDALVRIDAGGCATFLLRGGV